MPNSPSQSLHTYYLTFKMLPLTSSPAKRSTSRHRSSLGVYFRRVLKPSQMDFQYAFWTMIQLCRSPKTAYKQTSYHKQTKNIWARDDPAFVVVCAGLVALGGFGFSVFFSSSWKRAVSGIFSAVLVDYLLLGCAIATAGWILSNSYLRRRQVHSHTVEQSVEWMYAFDIHCNSYFPMFLVLYVLQLVLCPVLLAHTVIAVVLSNLIYLLAMTYYLYLTFLGYSALPFLDNTEAFLYPIGILMLLFPVAVLIGFNPTRTMLRLYYGYAS